MKSYVGRREVNVARDEEEIARVCMCVCACLYACVCVVVFVCVWLCGCVFVRGRVFVCVYVREKE